MSLRQQPDVPILPLTTRTTRQVSNDENQKNEPNPKSGHDDGEEHQSMIENVIRSAIKTYMSTGGNYCDRDNKAENDFYVSKEASCDSSASTKAVKKRRRSKKRIKDMRKSKNSMNTYAFFFTDEHEKGLSANPPFLPVSPKKTHRKVNRSDDKISGLSTYKNNALMRHAIDPDCDHPMIKNIVKSVVNTYIKNSIGLNSSSSPNEKNYNNRESKETIKKRRHTKKRKKDNLSKEQGERSQTIEFVLPPPPCDKTIMSHTGTNVTPESYPGKQQKPSEEIVTDSKSATAERNALPKRSKTEECNYNANEHEKIMGKNLSEISVGNNVPQEEIATREDSNSDKEVQECNETHSEKREEGNISRISYKDDLDEPPSSPEVKNCQKHLRKN